MAEAKLDITDELLVAYVDDELDAAQRAMVDATLERDPALCRRADEMRLARELLREAFPLPSTATLPARIIAAEERLAASCAQRFPRPRRALRFPAKYAIAAGLALCAVACAAYVAWQQAREPMQSVIALTRIDPGNPLHEVLESTPSARVVYLTADDAAVRAILTFRTKNGRFCREFEILAQLGAATGIACREQGYWRTEVLLSGAAAPPESHYYTPAAGPDDAAIDAVVERLMLDEPLGAQEEARVLAGGWRTGAPELS